MSRFESGRIPRGGYIPSVKNAIMLARNNQEVVIVTHHPEKVIAYAKQLGEDIGLIDTDGKGNSYKLELKN